LETAQLTSHGVPVRRNPDEELAAVVRNPGGMHAACQEEEREKAEPEEIDHAGT
jgi:hypothetical protein